MRDGPNFVRLVIVFGRSRGSVGKFHALILIEEDAFIFVRLL